MARQKLWLGALAAALVACAAPASEDSEGTTGELAGATRDVADPGFAPAAVPTDLAIGRALDDVIRDETDGAASKLLRRYETTRDGRTLTCEEIYIGDTWENVDRGFHPKRFTCTDGEVTRDTFSIFRDLEPDLPVRSFLDEDGDGRVDTIVDEGLQAHDANFDGKVDWVIELAPPEQVFASSGAARAWRVAPGGSLRSYARRATDYDGRFDRATFAADPGFVPVTP